MAEFQALCQLVDPWARPFRLVDPTRIRTAELGGEVSGVQVSNTLFLWEKEYSETLSFSLDTWELEREFLLALAACLWEAREYLSGAKVPEVRRVVIRERGGKTRVVTPLPSVLSFLGTFLNAWLLGLLAKDPRCDPFESPISPAWPVKEGEFIRSADLSRATDLIPGPLMERLARGVARGQGISGTSLEQALVLFTRPMRVLEAGGGFLTNGCPLMGAGPSWPLLNLFNLWLARSSFSSDRVRSVGDDLLAVGSFMESEKYNARLRHTGGSISTAKDTLSTAAGCLVERLCVVENQELTWYDSTSVGSLMGTSRVLRASDEVPAFAKGPGLSRAPGVAWLTRKVYEEEFRLLRACGIDPYLPREFGGGGFPASRSELRQAFRALRPHWVRALRVCMSQGPAGAVLLLQLQRPWSGRGEQGFPDLDSWVLECCKAWRVEAWRESSEIVDTPRYSLEEFQRLIEARLVPAFQLTFGFQESKAWWISPRSVRKGLDKALLRLNSTVPYPKLTDRARNIEKGLAGFLSKIKRDYFIVPVEFRVSPGFGAAEVGVSARAREGWTL
jgi:hypothetical protein